MNVEFKGKIIEIKIIEEVKNFKKQRVVVETIEQYPTKTDIEFLEKHLDKIKYLKIGDIVEFKCNIRSNEWNDKYINSLVCYFVKTNNENTKIANNKTKETQIEAPTVVEYDLPF